MVSSSVTMTAGSLFEEHGCCIFPASKSSQGPSLPVFLAERFGSRPTAVESFLVDIGEEHNV